MASSRHWDERFDETHMPSAIQEGTTVAAPDGASPELPGPAGLGDFGVQQGTLVEGSYTGPGWGTPGGRSQVASLVSVFQ